ncbi:MAG: MBL fold metallo-hydrolase, partial [Nocardioidaceae bacterium]
VVSIPGSGVVVVGDLVEQSGPPSYGDDSWPLEWPGSLDLVIDLTPADAVVVPGHGDAVDRNFMDEQHQQIVGIAEQVNQLALAGVTAGDAYDRGEWPYPREVMEPALARAFAHWTPPA